MSISLYTLAFLLNLLSNLLSLNIGSKSIGLFAFIVFWVDTLVTTWLFFVALHLRILSVTNLKSIQFLHLVPVILS